MSCEMQRTPWKYGLWSLRGRKSLTIFAYQPPSINEVYNMRIPLLPSSLKDIVALNCLPIWLHFPHLSTFGTIT
jgi:hypothetical protein